MVNFVELCADKHCWEDEYQDGNDSGAPMKYILRLYQIVQLYFLVQNFLFSSINTTIHLQDLSQSLSKSSRASKKHNWRATEEEADILWEKYQFIHNLMPLFVAVEDRHALVDIINILQYYLT